MLKGDSAGVLGPDGVSALERKQDLFSGSTRAEKHAGLLDLQGDEAVDFFFVFGVEDEDALGGWPGGGARG